MQCGNSFEFVVVRATVPIEDDVVVRAEESGRGNEHVAGWVPFWMDVQDIDEEASTTADGDFCLREPIGPSPEVYHPVLVLRTVG